MSILQKYFSRLPEVTPEFRSSIGEGNTPLLPSRKIGKELGIENLYFKCEHLNPTGSYKDRYVALEMSLLRQSGVEFVMGTSSGNTGSSLATFACRYDLSCFLFVTENTPEGKLLQMRAHGAKVFPVRGFGVTPESTERGMRLLGELGKQRGVRSTISAFKFCPEGMLGVQSLSWEILEQLDSAPNHVFVPGGGCGLYVATAKGFANSASKINIVQPDNNDTVVTPLRGGKERAQVSPTATTISGLAVPQVLDGHEAIAQARSCGGTGFLIKDADAHYWQRELMQQEGVWVEPAGAVALAGVARAAEEKYFQPDESVVCIMTGHGFKDPSSTESNLDAMPEMIDVEDFAGIIG